MPTSLLQDGSHHELKELTGHEAAPPASRRLHWLGVCVQRGDVDGLCKSPAALLLLSHCLCDDDGLQLHLLGHAGQTSLRGDVDASVVGRPHRDALWPRAAAHSCTPDGVASSGEEGGMMNCWRGHGAMPPLAGLPLAMDLVTLLTC